MNKSSVILKTTGGTMCLVSVWLLITFVPIPNPATYVNHALAVSVLTSFFVGIGLIGSAVKAEW